jgi:hypothetical protein
MTFFARNPDLCVFGNTVQKVSTNKGEDFSLVLIGAIGEILKTEYSGAGGTGHPKHRRFSPPIFPLLFVLGNAGCCSEYS